MLITRANAKASVASHVFNPRLPSRPVMVCGLISNPASKKSMAQPKSDKNKTLSSSQIWFRTEGPSKAPPMRSRTVSGIGFLGMRFAISGASAAMRAIRARDMKS